MQVLNAEKWASLAWLDGTKYPGDELTEDWKKVLFNQFHDLAAGSGIGVIYKDAQKDYDVVRYSTNEISAQRAADGGRAREHGGHGHAGGGLQSAGLGALGRSRRARAGRQGRRSVPSGAQVVEVKPDEKTGFADVRLHVLQCAGAGIQSGVGWRRKARGRASRESGVDSEGRRQRDHA